MDENSTRIPFWKKLWIAVLTILTTYFFLAAVDVHNHSYSQYDVIVNWTLFFGFIYTMFRNLQGLEVDWTMRGEALLIQGMIIAATSFIMALPFVLMLDWSQHYGIKTWWAFPIAVVCMAFSGIIMMLFTDLLNNMFPPVVGTEREEKNG